MTDVGVVAYGTRIFMIYVYYVDIFNLLTVVNMYYLFAIITQSICIYHR